MKLSIYKNPRNDHTYQVNRQGDRFLIVERDWIGNVFQVMAIYNRQENAQDVLDKLCDAMDWRFCGEQEEAGQLDG
jgi:hypothetical protein